MGRLSFRPSAAALPLRGWCRPLSSGCWPRWPPGFLEVRGPGWVRVREGAGKCRISRGRGSWGKCGRGKKRRLLQKILCHDQRLPPSLLEALLTLLPLPSGSTLATLSGSARVVESLPSVPIDAFASAAVDAVASWQQVASSLKPNPSSQQPSTNNQQPTTNN